MPEFTLYGNPGSSASDRVTLTLAEGGFTDYEFVIMDFMKADHKQPAHLARNPYGRVPVITTSDGVTLYESRAIAKYLASRYGFTHLLPQATDPLATARFDQAQSVEMCYFADHAGKVSFEKFVKPIFGGVTDEQAVEGAVKAIEKHFDIHDGLLGKPGQQYMAGDTFSLVDIYYIPQVARLFDLGYGDIITSRANIKSWWERCMARPVTAKFVEGMPKKEAVMKKFEARKEAS